MSHEEPPPRLFGAVFWIAIAFGLLCVAAAVVVWRLGPVLWPLHSR